MVNSTAPDVPGLGCPAPHAGYTVVRL